MISINFTGNTLREVADQAGMFVAAIFTTIIEAPQTPTVATVEPLPLVGEPPINTGYAGAFDPKCDPMPELGHDLVPTAEAVADAKRKRRTKAEMEAARAAAATGELLDGKEVGPPSAIEVAAEATAATPAPAAAAPEVADVKAALMQVVEKDGLGPTAGGKLLAQFGVKRVSELEAKTFAGFIAACNAAVAA